MDIRELEKNKYYYGKLLTVTDFEIEQQYYAKKTKLTNRIMFGVGIISGLQVTRINDTQFAVESGVAIDYDGNMILIPIPLTITLSNLSGYLYDGPAHESFYICLRYKEKEKDIVESTNSHVSSKFNETTYNRVVESYDLHLQQGLNNEDFSTKKVKQSKKVKIDRHFDQSLSEMIQHNGQNCICLAKIDIERKEKAGIRSQEYNIEQVELVPFQQYVYNHDLLKSIAAQRDVVPKPVSNDNFTVSSVVKAIDSNSNHEVDVSYDKHKKNFEFEFGVPKEISKESAVTTGVLDIELKSNLFVEGFISEEISHGLGLGIVYLDTAIEKKDNWLMDEPSSIVYYGDSDVFTKTDDEIDLKNYSVGCILYAEKGTFKIGVKYHGAKKGDSLRVRWWAIKAKEDK